MARVLVIGMGSAHGDDQAGWKLASMLQAAPPAGATVAAVSDPSALLNRLGDCDRLIVVDAMRTGAPPGTVGRWTWPDAGLEQKLGRSSHGVGVGSVLSLAERLGLLPAEVILLGIEAENIQPGAALSPVIADALPQLCARVRQEMGCEPCMHSGD